MAGVLFDATLTNQLAALLTALGTLTLKLARNNVSISRSSILSDFTEANFSGYSSQTVGAFGTPTFDSSTHRWSAAAAALIFQNTTGVVGNSIYAAYAVDSAGHLVWAEEVTGGPGVPVDMTTSGKLYSYQPVIDLSSRASTSP